MTNPFQPGDKVRTKRKGEDINAVVRTIWNHEVQVRAEAGDLLWRTMKTIELVERFQLAESKDALVEAESLSGDAPPMMPEEPTANPEPLEVDEPTEEPLPDQEDLSPDVIPPAEEESVRPLCDDFDSTMKQSSKRRMSRSRNRK